jgi:protein-L-isoaspartate(D-aspartate) O-methyltransferase
MTVADWPARAAEMARRCGARDPEVRRALASVPRDRFVPPEYETSAYEDEPLPLTGGESTISAPHMVAIMLEAARLSDGLSVLEVGSGGGYLVALLSEMMHRTGRILGLEVDPELAARSLETLRSLGYGGPVEIRAADGWAGAPDRAPFDRILVSCAVPELAPAWRAELAPGGRIVAPVGDSWGQRLLTFSDRADPIEIGPECRFVSVRRARDPIYRA